MRCFWIITLTAKAQRGLSEVEVMNTIDGTTDVTPGMTREQVFRIVLAEAERAWRTTTTVISPVAVLFYSLEPQVIRVPGSERI